MPVKLRMQIEYLQKPVALFKPYLAPTPNPNPVQKNFSLNAPMINRVHNAKPGCSACGKKVM
jgi:hypothetical protein